MSIGLALAAALVFGTGDFLGGLATRRTRVLTVLVISHALGLAGMAAVSGIFDGSPTGADLIAGAIGGIGGGAGVAMLYRGLALGTMALVAPVTGVVAAFIPVVYGAVTGERPSPVQYAGIVLALLAVSLISRARRATGTPLRGAVLLLAIGSGAAFGLFYIALAKTSAGAGLWPLVAARGASVTAFVFASAMARQLPRTTRPTLLLILAVGVFDITANALYVIAVHHGLLSIVAVLVSLYPAATVLCSLVVLRERLQTWQMVGVAVALAAVVLITAG